MKIFKVFLISILLISILTTSIFLCACDKDSNTDGTPSGSMPSGNPGISSGEPDDDGYRNADWIKIYTSYKSTLKDDTYSTIINSVEDLLAMCDEDTSPVFEKSNYGSNQEIIDKFKEYDEEFFKEKSLAVIFGWQGSGVYYVKDFEIEDESLNVTLVHEVIAGVVYPDDVCDCVYILEFPKEQVKDVTQINVDQIFVIKK